MKRVVTIGIVLVVLLASIGTVSANLVGNPGFETPSITGNWNTYSAGDGALTPWKIDAQSIDLIHDGWDPASEDQSLDLSGNNRAIISQDIPTQPGNFYQLSFAMAGNTYEAPQIKTVEVFWDGVSKGTFDFDTTGHTPTNMGWTIIGPITGLPASSGSTTELKFQDITASGDVRAGVALDDIVVDLYTAPAIPEFPSMALPVGLIVGLIGAILFIRKSKEN
jgi:choice-of-anchor C domain-containing protein